VHRKPDGQRLWLIADAIVAATEELWATPATAPVTDCGATATASLVAVADATLVGAYAVDAPPTAFVVPGGHPTTALQSSVTPLATAASSAVTADPVVAAVAIGMEGIAVAALSLAGSLTTAVPVSTLATLPLWPVALHHAHAALALEAGCDSGGTPPRPRRPRGGSTRHRNVGW